MARLRRFGILVALTVGGSLAVTAQETDRRPKLIVLLMVDQMRGDYIDKFRAQWSGGLQRLVSSGAWFRQADYPYYNTVTCAGHTTVATGTLPWTHGMVMNGWWDRTRNREVACTDDPHVSLVSYGKPVPGAGNSAAPIRVATLADELRAQLSPAARVVTFSLKARSAIPLGGRHPDAVAWFDDSGTFVTSTAFTNTPTAAVADFIRRRPVEGDVGKVWQRTLPVSAYLYEERAIGAHAPEGLSTSFPHPLGGDAHKLDQAFYDRWQESPFSDEYLADMTLAVASAMHLGRTATTDLMAIGFSALDKVGHDYGPNSHEVQDVLVRLDRTLARFFAELDAAIGPGNYVVALTGDHGVSPVPERLAAYGIESGRISHDSVDHVVETALADALGPGRYVSRVVDGNIYLHPGVLDRVVARTSVLEAVRRAVRQIPGVQDLRTRDVVSANAADDDVVGRRLAHSYDVERSGDLFLIAKPYWTMSETGTGHGSPYAYDSRVPILMMGTGIQPGEYLAPVSPADIAPTLALLAGVTLPRAEGRVLTEALALRRENSQQSPAIQTRN